MNTVLARARRQCVTLSRRRPVATFLVVAFAWSWAYFGLYTVALEGLVGGLAGRIVRLTPDVIGPVVGAIVVTRLSGGDVRALLGQVTEWRAPPRWYLLAFALPLLVYSIDGLLGLASGTPVSTTVQPARFLLLFVGGLLLAGALEEFGWRGFMQPRLARRYGTSGAAVVVGVAWALWHLPDFLAGSLGPAFSTPLFFPYIVALSVVIGWVYTQAGLLPAMILHASHNASGLAVDASGGGWLASNGMALSTAAWILLAAAFVAYYGSGAGESRARRGTPGSTPE